VAEISYHRQILLLLCFVTTAGCETAKVTSLLSSFTIKLLTMSTTDLVMHLMEKLFDKITPNDYCNLIGSAKIPMEPRSCLESPDPSSSPPSIFAPPADCCGMVWATQDQTFFAQGGGNSLVTGLFHSHSTCQNVRCSISLLYISDVIHGNNGDH